MHVVAASAPSCSNEQHANAITIAIDPASPPAGPVTHEGCEYAQSLTFSVPSGSTLPLNGIAFQFVSTRVAGDLTFASGLRLGGNAVG